MKRTVIALIVAIAQSGSLQERPKTAAAPPSRHEVADRLRAIKASLDALMQQLDSADRRSADGALNRVEFKVPIANAIGHAKAPFTIVEIADLECPFCRQYARSTFDVVKSAYVDTGVARYIAVDLPLSDIHPNALTAARAARCAGEQERFWEFRQALLSGVSKIDQNSIAAITEALRIDMEGFQSCLATERYREEIVQEARRLTTSGVSATPTFIIGRMTADGTIRGLSMEGIQDLQMFDKIITQLATEHLDQR